MIALAMPMFGYLVGFIGAFGLAVGSFLNVVIHRVPRGLSVVSPPSCCPACSSAIRPVDNIPVVSWLLLGARCRHCATRISARYPMVELGTAILFGGVALAVGVPFLTAGGNSRSLPSAVLTLISLLYLAAVSISLSAIDLDTQTLPNAIIFPSYGVVVALLAAASLCAGESDAFLRGVLGLAALFLFYAILAFAVPGGMGFGDVKLSGILGFYLAYFGWDVFLVGAFSAFIFGGIFALLQALLTRAVRRKGIPFGPWMLFGAWIGLACGHSLFAGYLTLFGFPAS